MDFINDTSFSIISDYIPLTQLLNISKKHMMKRIPSIVNIKSFEEYDTFKKWCELFNPSNIITVNISISHSNRRLNNLNITIDYVPRSVKNVNILKFEYIVPFTRINLPDNVENLKVDNTFADIVRLPANIQTLTLGYKFHGIVYNFTSNLSCVELFGYNEGGRQPCQINNLPDTITTIKMYVYFPGQINYWPINSVIIPIEPDDDQSDEHINEYFDEEYY